MTAFRFPLAFLLVTLALPAAGAQSPSLERIVSLPSLTGTEPVSPVWAPE